ncbi:nucleotidyltransferase domain-containing protein [Yangia sp. PrR003]|nr:nucleotidyltransferase domain-containing protein [Salipiger sp. PrR003]
MEIVIWKSVELCHYSLSETGNLAIGIFGVKHEVKLKDLPDEVKLLVSLCKAELLASEVWLFGSRARGDNSPESDFDILAVVPDDAPEGIDTPRAVFRLRRKSKARADLFTARASEFLGASMVPNTISYAVAQEGVRLDR